MRKNSNFEQKGEPIEGLKDLKKLGFLVHHQLPSGLSYAPFKWRYYSTEYNMEFIAGFTSYTQDKETLALRPKIGWAVREKPTLSHAKQNFS
ncbi:DUF4419 domain-containing protein [[Phormidium] sp. ETS-05]|uniref:DUF4419 domain-containing protein n=1 Tax=[Phormidium] sp. ETS-05 TaxID=222819 RepID=UPI002105BDB2|nr:DUF4419 domain-containing protein [[Phormidium] sp. ETS-05]